MKPYTHPKDEGLLLQRKMGKRKRAGWKVAAIAKGAPHELDALPEDPIRRQIEAEIQATGLPYLTFEDADLYWLKNQAAKGSHNAMRILAAIKDLPDFTLWRPAPGMPYALSLPLELKKAGKGGRPGQRAFAQAAGGVITHGYTEAHGALECFTQYTIPNKEER